MLYGHEKVDDTLVESILKKGQLEPIVVTKNKDEDKYTIISGHRRWTALKDINENTKRPIKLKEGSEVHYDKDNPLPFVEMKARCVVVNLPTKESRILAIIDYNKRRKKRWSQYYNEIRVLHSLYDPEAEHERNRHLRQFSDSPDLKKRHKKEKDSKLSDKDYYGKLYDEGTITDNEIFESDKYKYSYKKGKNETTQDIANEINLGRTNVIKLTKIGDLAYKKNDEVAIDIMERLDFEVWSLNNAFNVYTLREFQDHFEKDSELYKELDGIIKKVLDTTKNHDKNVKEGIVTDRKVKEFQDIIDKMTPEETEKKKVKDQFDVILIEPDENAEIEDLNAAPNSALFVISNPGNLGRCIKLISKLKYSIQTYYFVDGADGRSEDLILLGTRDFESPDPEHRPSISRNEIYDAIKELYPNKNYHEVPNKNTPEEEPLGWEIPIDKLVSNKQAEKLAMEAKQKAKEETERAEAEKERIKAEKKRNSSTNKELLSKQKEVNQRIKEAKKAAKEAEKNVKGFGKVRVQKNNQSSQPKAS